VVPGRVVRFVLVVLGGFLLRRFRGSVAR
jgi:hypothetical protein